MPRKPETVKLSAFPSALGWVAMLGTRGKVHALTFGHATPAAAIRALDADGIDDARIGTFDARLERRLQAFAEGKRVTFDDVKLDVSSLTDFQRAVIKRCRAIPYGQTLTYGELAKAIGAAGAARAVGTVMARNCVPLIVPCHRVLAAGGRPGGYSAGEGVRMKLRLLEMEAGRKKPRTFTVQGEPRKAKS